MQHTQLAATLALGALTIAVNAAPRSDDFQRGIEVTSYDGRPLVELVVPDEVYQGVTRADLGDVRVFNADGAPVPHAFCAAPATVAPVVTQESLPIFDLQAGTPEASGSSTSVQVETAGGTQVRIQEGGPATDPTASRTQTWAHVIDARGVQDDLRSIEFDWSSPDGASQASVRIEASDDLDRWRTVVSSSTLLRVTRDGQQLQRKTVPLVEQRYSYLRVVRTDGGPPLQIAQVIGERVARPGQIEPVWFHANAQGIDGGQLRFDATRLAPITYARLVVPDLNSSVRIRLQSRADEQASWRERWSGEAYSIVKDGERRVSPPAQMDGAQDRFWQVTALEPSQALNPATGLELGYRPARLRFLAQGSGPYTLAFGSRRAEPAPIQQCSSLLSDVRGEDLEPFIGTGLLGTPRNLGGETALKPLPKPTPVRLIVLWGVLILGVGLLIGMAVSLLKRVR
ncbi:MAG TPA: DUF3999 domain-containing protein [Povalibacter sp.]